MARPSRAIHDGTQMSKGAPIRVFLCDDAEPFRALMRFSLAEDGEIEVVGEAGDGEAGVAAVAALRPDVVLLDLSMPRCDGMAAIPRMRRESPATAIVALSGFDTERMAAAVRERGAYAYLEKGVAVDEIRAAIHGAHANARAGAPA
jgi:DNA-binding NarL/FixJ family response regulator